MRIKVEFYDVLRELAGRQEWSAEVPESSTVLDLWMAARSSFPELDSYPREPVFTAGLDYVEPTHRVSERETISILPALLQG